MLDNKVAINKGLFIRTKILFLGTCLALRGHFLRISKGNLSYQGLLPVYIVFPQSSFLPFNIVHHRHFNTMDFIYKSSNVYIFYV